MVRTHVELCDEEDVTLVTASPNSKETEADKSQQKLEWVNIQDIDFENESKRLEALLKAEEKALRAVQAVRRLMRPGNTVLDALTQELGRAIATDREALSELLKGTTKLSK